MGTPMFEAALFTTAKGASTPVFTNKLWSINTMECYSPFKRKEVLVNSTLWMSPEGMVLNERS